MFEVGWEADGYMTLFAYQTMYLAGGLQSTQTSKIATKSKGRIKRVFWYFQKKKNSLAPFYMRKQILNVEHILLYHAKACVFLLSPSTYIEEH
jgi:hypothetical protein